MGVRSALACRRHRDVALTLALAQRGEPGLVGASANGRSPSSAVGGSDYHCPAGADTNFLRLGQPTTWVKATERSVPAVLDAIRAGRVSISAHPKGPLLDLRGAAADAVAEMGQVLRLAPDSVAEVAAHVVRGAGWTLRLIADGQAVHETLINADIAAVRLRVDRQHLRARRVGR